MEKTEPTNEFEFRPRRLKAAAEIAATEKIGRSARVRSEALNPAEEGLTPQQRIARVALRTAFYDLVEQADLDIDDGIAVVDWLAEQPNVIPSATLGRIEMNGEWDAADRFERDLFPILSTLYDKGYRNFNTISRTSNEANIRVTIPAGFTKETGYVALRRKRRFITASPQEPRSDLPPITIHKASMFALDINKLAVVSDVAVREVRLIVARTMFLAVDWQALGDLPVDIDDMNDEDAMDVLIRRGSRIVGDSSDLQHGRSTVADGEDRFFAALEDVKALSSAIRRYNIHEAEMKSRLYEMQDPTYLHNPESLEFVEAALHDRNELLTPALTTYYVRS